MNVAAPRSTVALWIFRLYILAFLVYLAVPLAAAGLFAFNDSLFPALPWQGLTLDWFFGTETPKLGVFQDRRLMQSVRNSLGIGVVVAFLATAAGLANAFLFERRDLRFKSVLYVAMVLPLVVPGVILGISILVFASTVAAWMEDATGLDMTVLRPGLPLVVAGQFSFLVTIATLVVGARLKKFDASLEDAALNLGASRLRILMTVTVPFLMPALSASFLVSFLVSFQDFNTTLMLVGSDSPLTITMYDRMAKSGSTPVLNAMSVVLILGSGALALLSALVQRARPN